MQQVTYFMSLGNAIKLCRTKKNYTQSELAEKADISISYLSLLEQGKRDPSFSTVEKLASALEVPVSMLVFLGTPKEELAGISSEVAEKLSLNILQLLASK